ncbi:site-specific DNA-methyltransferase [Sneathiella sp.]|uniref:site-specific DNA-methyltransferase n=1 Tax=Sneathiella sp. TaxID=1964365 RepID=UPI003569EB83
MARLTEQEQQDIIRFIEADKPLPEKYRFLLFEDKREVELVWNGKTSEVSNVVLPFQTIEQVDEPRAEKPEDTAAQQDLFATDSRGRQLKGWTNKLIWGDNKLILSSLKNGPLREEIERQGGLKLIYIDPPFDVGADFSMDIEVGGDTFTKKPNILEEIAYRDTWGKGADSFIAMIYERFMLMRDLLAENGSIYVHCDWRVNGYIRLTLDEIFGKSNFLNNISWKRTPFAGSSKARSNKFPINQDTIYLYAKNSGSYVFNQQYIDYSDEYKERFKYKDQVGLYRKTLLKTYSADTETKLKENDRWIDPGKPGSYPSYKQYLHESKGKQIEDIWTDVNSANPMADERVDYPTQKPEALLDRIIRASSNEGDLVADFFAGSGTTAAVAEKLGRKWIVGDLGKFAVHTTRKRMIGVQRGLKADGKDYRAFEILNLGRYERQHYVGVNPNLREEQRRQQLEEKEKAFLNLILRAYRAERTDGFASFHGKRAGRLVAVGPVNMPVSRLFVEEIILECRKKHITKVDILGFEFEMGLFPNVLDEARTKGIDIAPKYIPADVFDKRAVEKNQVVFHDVSFIEVKPHLKGNSVAVELTDFSVFYSQDSIANAEATLKDKGSRIVVEKGQIVKVSKDKDGIVTRETLTENWTDWIDYWSVDFDFESKREIVRTQNPDTEEWEEAWTGDYIFENEWQSFRTKKDRTLELTSVFHECPPGRRKIAVKVVDIFGNDTMTIAEVTVGEKK